MQIELEWVALIVAVNNCCVAVQDAEIKLINNWIPEERVFEWMISDDDVSCEDGANG